MKMSKSWGSAKYLALTFWSDGYWRAVEDEVVFPVYGEEEALKKFEKYGKDKVTLVWHEGCKGPYYWNSLIERNLAYLHPFGELLGDPTCVHVGCYGGVDRTAHSNLKKLGEMKWKQVIYWPDNDSPGRRVLPKIAYHFSVSDGRMFRTTTAEGFDRKSDGADPLPQALFQETRGTWFYRGSSPDSFLIPYNWLTTQDVFGKITIREHLESKYVQVETGSKGKETSNIHHVDYPNNRLSERQFRKYFRRLSHPGARMDDLVTETCLGYHYSPDLYNPNDPIVRIDNQEYFNTYMPTQIKPRKFKGKPQKVLRPLYKLMRKLIADPEEFQFFWRYWITLVAQPKTRILFCILLTSQKQGTGKSILANRLVGDLVGQRNVRSVTETEINSEFSGWKIDCRLVIIDEVSSRSGLPTYTRTKNTITAKSTIVNDKHEKVREIPNFIHFIITTNDPGGYAMEPEDRRAFVPKFSDSIIPQAEINAFLEWWDKEGAALTLYYFLHWEEINPEEFAACKGYFKEGDHAPATDQKKQLLHDSLGPVGQICVEIIEDMHSFKDKRGREKPVIITAKEICDYITRELKPKDDTKSLPRAEITLKRIRPSIGFASPEGLIWPRQIYFDKKLGRTNAILNRTAQNTHTVHSDNKGFDSLVRDGYFKEENQKRVEEILERGIGERQEYLESLKPKGNSL